MFCPTGVPPLEIRQSRDKIREELGFKKEDFVVLFIDRHNEYKGFDLLLKSVIELRKNYKNMYLLSAGRGPLAEEHKNYKEFWKYLGFIENAGDLIEASDVHCIPNKESYFDIGLIESLSIGTPIITTGTGGHKFFKKKSKGIIIVNPTIQDLMNALLYIKNYPLYAIENMKNENKKFYEENFSLDIFAKNFIDVIQKIYSCQ